jgi:hypothetical protein
VHDETGKPYSSSAQRHHSHHSFTAGWPNPNFRDLNVASSVSPRSSSPPTIKEASRRGGVMPMPNEDGGDGRWLAFSWEGVNCFSAKYDVANFE